MEMGATAPRGTKLERSGDLAENFAVLREEALTFCLAVTGVVFWCWIASYLPRHDDFWPGWGLPLALLPILALCYGLKGRSYPAASSLFIAALFVGTILLLLGSPDSVLAPFPFVVIVLIAGVLNGPRLSGTVAIVVTLVILAVGGARGATLPTAVATGLLVLTWLAWLASWATTRHLYTALDWAWSYSELAERNLEETQRHRGLLAAALAQLEQATYRLERANYALAWARAEADQARRLKAQFAAHVSHELRTPLNLIVGFSDLMLDHPEAYGGADLDPAYRSDLAALQRSARQLQALVDDILDLSQIDAGEMPIIKDLTEIGAIVTEAVATARPLLDRKGLTVQVEIASGLPMLNVDRLRVRQVLLNLLNNAARFTDRGGVTIRVSARAAEVLVEVADTGRGIAPSSLMQLFEPYRQLETAPEHRTEGTGLGLSIAKRFVELHGGRIWARSDGIPGQGSTFAFVLPIQGDDTAETEDLIGEFRARGHTLANPPDPAVVVLAPDPAAVRIFRRRLHRYRVVGATDIDEAIRLCQPLGAHALIVTAADSTASVTNPQWSTLAIQCGTRVLRCPLPGSRALEHDLDVDAFLVKPITRDVLFDSMRTIGPNARTVLIIDDDPAMVRLLARMLRSAPDRYDVLRAYDGAEGLDILRYQRTDLIFLDLVMPGIDGRAFLARVRADPALAAIPVIAISAQSPIEAPIPAAESQISLIHAEPLPLPQLVRSVQSILDSLPPRLSAEERSGRGSPGGPPG